MASAASSADAATVTAARRRRRERRPLPEPLVVDADGAAALAGGSRSWWWSLWSSARCPMGFMLAGKRLWQIEEIRGWVFAGCPPRSEWTARQHAAKETERLRQLSDRGSKD